MKELQELIQHLKDEKQKAIDKAEYYRKEGLDRLVYGFDFKAAAFCSAIKEAELLLAQMQHYAQQPQLNKHDVSMLSEQCDHPYAAVIGEERDAPKCLKCGMRR